MIVGTAGHVDHGKTALVKALTGVDADRLKEEKARGITIDLGFAYASLAPGGVTGFVDVPGHERFVHTMLAGAAGIDLALLVVAADDGVMPQTREHVAILDLLGLKRCLVALTKADLANDARRASVTAQIHALLAATHLRNAPVLPVSCVTGEGIDDLRAHLALAEMETHAAPRGGLFRMSIDRCFTLAGAGTVVTGCITSGVVTVGDRVTVSPSGLPARVRSLHASNQAAQRAVAGQRCALNLAGDGIGKDRISRGDVVLDPILHAPTTRIDAQLHLLASETKPVGDWHPARLHHASADVDVRIVPLEEPLAAGRDGRVQLVLERPIAAVVGDRFVLRDTSSQRTIGGGQFLDLRAPLRKRRTPERFAQLAALAERDPADAFARLLAVAPYFVDVGLFGRDHALSETQVAELGADAATVRLEAGDVQIVLASTHWNRFAQALMEALARFHAEHPGHAGHDPRTPPSRAGTATPTPHLRRGARELGTRGMHRLGWRIHPPLRSCRSPHGVGRRYMGLPPSTAWLGCALSSAPRSRPRDRSRPARGRHPARPEALRAVGTCRPDCARSLFLRDTTRDMAAFARELTSSSESGEFTAAQFRDRMDNGRKVAIQILDFFDRYGVTTRRGDLRRANPRRTDLFGPVAGDGRESFPVGRPDFKSGWGSQAVSGGFDSHSLPPSPGI